MKNKTKLKFSTAIFLSLFLCKGIMAQKDTLETIFKKNKEASIGFFFEPEMKFYFQNQRFNEPVALVLGSKTAMVFNKNFIFGISGHGKVTPSTYYGVYKYKDDYSGEEITHSNQKMRTEYGYAGIIFGGIVKPNKAVHASFTSLFGGGTSNEFIIKDNGSKGTTFNSPTFFILEPTIDLEANLSKFFRLKAGVTYKYILASKFESLSSNDLSGIGLQIGVKIGPI